MNLYRQAKQQFLSILLLAPLAALADDGFYVGASIGSADLNEDFNGLTIDTDSTAFRLVGGWSFNEYFAVEAGYQDFGNFEQQIDINGTTATVNLNADGYTIGIAGTLRVTEKVSIDGRLGMFFWDGAAEINGVTQASPEDSNLYFGIGTSYALTDRFNLSVDFSRFDLEEAQSNVFSLGFKYAFGG